MFWVGLVLFALGIFVSVCLHEAGHMVTAKAFGMKVTQYFAGFGPTVWSFRRGETEYGLKAVPAGGFVKIVGMTPLEPVAAQDDDRAFWRSPLWQRTVVLSAGSITHFLLAAIVAWIAAVTTGLPNVHGIESFSAAKAAPVVSVADCVPASATATTCTTKDSPARVAGLHDGDRILAVGSTPVSTYGALVTTLRAVPAGPVVLHVQRGAEQVDVPITPQRVTRTLDDGTTGTVSAIGVFLDASQAPPNLLHYDAAGAFGGTAVFGREVVSATFGALKDFPSRVPKLVDAIGGGTRDADTPVSVLGASRIGGEAVERGLTYIALTAFVQLNVFIGIFNLFPLLPLDGGHIAVAWFERVRSALARRLGRPDPGRVDYAKLMPLTYAVILLFGVVTLLTLTADIVNPIRLS
ncbi:RIP metalloprotease RseP [Motilibacter peucedani]|uniref:RIP metalloprotease RseP n=1 Tax=Motilibacter peucedani TaxID=598650 RepID=A0A420XRB0_9ACTN|nr:site-2 protease family protein [Motilibacter peucedani]RKS77370.1 RIP metalloprotease RseP [Motilibacter peucedani]